MTRTDISTRKIPTIRQAAGNAKMVTIARAVASVAETGEPRFVFPTFNKWNIGHEAPPWGGYYEFSSEGRWEVGA